MVDGVIKITLDKKGGMKTCFRTGQDRTGQDRTGLPKITRNIYEHMQDELSKSIYQERLRYTFTGDAIALRRIVDMMDFDTSAIKKIQNCDGKAVIYGAGKRGTIFFRMYPEIKWDCFIDVGKAGSTVNGLPVIGLDDVKAMPVGSCILISNLSNNDEIARNLVMRGVPKENIVSTRAMEDKLIESQYFDLDALPHDKEEVFIDGGCFDGFTDRQFIRWAGKNGYKGIYAFEPNPILYGKCQKALSDIDNVTLIKKGLYSADGELEFYATDDMNGTLGKNCTNNSIKEKSRKTVVKVTMVDNVCEFGATFIKMDLEGGEYDALIGAEKTIRKCHPKLAISIYHKPEDIWELPKLILEIDPSYKFYLRHYSLHDAETVLYAV